MQSTTVIQLITAAVRAFHSDHGASDVCDRRGASITDPTRQRPSATLLHRRRTCVVSGPTRNDHRHLRAILADHSLRSTTAGADGDPPVGSAVARGSCMSHHVLRDQSTPAEQKSPHVAPFGVSPRHTGANERAERRRHQSIVRPCSGLGSRSARISPGRHNQTGI